MTRFLLPFLLALTVHGLISQLSWEQKQVQLPEAGGIKSIDINIENLSVPEEQHKIESSKIEPPPQAQRPAEDKAKAEELPAPTQLPSPKKVQIKSVKQKVVQKSFTKTVASPPRLQTTLPPKEQKQKNQSYIISNASLTPNTPQQQAATIQAKPMYQKNPKPPYPPLARRRNWQGTVVLLVTVDIQGQSQKVKIVKGSGYSILDKTAKKTVLQWKFTPGQINGSPTAMEVQVPIHFILE